MTSSEVDASGARCGLDHMRNQGMRQGSNSRRGRSGRPNGKRSFSQGGGPNRSHESNGPNVKLRGTAVQVYDKYQGLARDSTSSGDRVAAENYFQHAEHYYRIMNIAKEEAAARASNEGGGRDNAQGRRSNGRDHESVEAGSHEEAQRNGNGTPAADGEDSAGPDETIN